MTEPTPIHLTGEDAENGKRIAAGVTSDVQALLWRTLDHFGHQPGGEFGVMEGFLHGFLCVAWEMRKASSPELDEAAPLAEMVAQQAAVYLAHLNAVADMGEAKGTA